MKLYAFQPKGFGEESLFVMAENEDKAREAVSDKINELIAKGEDDNYWEVDGNYSHHHFNGWGTDYYNLTVLKAGEVILNSND